VSSASGPACAVEPTGKSPLLAAGLAFMLPGLGHLYLGWRRRGVLYMVILLFMYCFGLVLHGSLSRPGSGAFLASLGTLGDLGIGPLYFVISKLGYATGRVAAATHEIGNAFHWSAGVMNMLLVLDAHDIATGAKTCAGPAVRE
jgi:hypothetical protein